MGLKLAKDYVPIENRPIQRKVTIYRMPINKSAKSGTMAHASLELGKCRSYFSQMKLSFPERYERICELGNGDLIEGSRLLDKELDDVTAEFCTAMSRLGKHHRQGLFAKYIGMNRNTLATIIRTSRKGTVRKMSALNTMKMLLEKYEEFIKW